jgi:hypothetical protein
MGEAGTNQHPADEHRSVGIAFSRQEQLPSRTATREGKGETRQHHTAEIPPSVRLGNWLVSKSGLELTQGKVGQNSGHDERQYAVQ